MSEEVAQEEQVAEAQPVTLTPEQFKQMMDQIANLSKKVEEVTHELAEAKKAAEQVPTRSAPRMPVFHSQSVQDAQMGRAMREAEQHDRIQQSLDRAADFAIVEYQKNPAKHRR